MSALWFSLPACAGDYSGAAEALFPLRPLILIADASGCTGNYLTFDEPRNFDSPMQVFSAGLRSMDVILGRDDRLTDRLKEACSALKPPLAVLLGTPVPTLTGTDLKGIAREVEADTGVPCIAPLTTGLKPYHSGIAQALKTVLSRFARRGCRPVRRRVNVLGMTPMDMTEREAVGIRRFLEAYGFEPGLFLSMGAELTLEALESFGAASLNLAVTRAGAEAAESLRRLFPIPWVCAFPAGCEVETAELMEQTLKDGQCRVLNRPSRPGGTLLIGEQVRCSALKARLLRQEPGRPIAWASLTGVCKAIAAPGDRAVSGEEELTALLESGEYSALAGDPLLQALLPDGMDFMPLPHRALSGSLMNLSMEQDAAADMPAFRKEMGA